MCSQTKIPVKMNIFLPACLLTSSGSWAQLTQILCAIWCVIFFGVLSVSSDPKADVLDRKTPPRGSEHETGAPLRAAVGPNSSMCCSDSGSPSPEGRGAFVLETQLCCGKLFVTVISHSRLSSYQGLSGLIGFIFLDAVWVEIGAFKMLHQLSSK